jgi:F-type H+-transporting ATPase subunit b
MRLDWWTLAFQTVNVLVLVWILARFFFRPIAAIVAKRQEKTDKLFADAAAARQAAADARSEAKKEHAEIAAERDRLLAEAQKSAQSEKAKLLEQVSQEVAKLRRESEAAITRDRAAVQQQIIEHASALSIEIARRLLERLPSNVGSEMFLAGLCHAVHTLSMQARGSFVAATTSGHPIEIVTSVPLSDQETQHVRQALNEAFGLELPFAFRVDSKLLAGIELHGHNTILRNSWRADLERIREELSREQHPSEP